MPTKMYIPSPKKSAKPDISSIDEPQDNQADNWLADLNTIRQAAEQTHESASPVQKVTFPDPNDLLKRVKALQRLRDIQKVVLKGQAMIQKFEQVDTYQAILALLWVGNIANPSRPRVMSEAEQCIFIGVSKQHVYINGQKITPTSPDGLQKQLLITIKNPVNLKSEHILADRQATYEE